MTDSPATDRPAFVPPDVEYVDCHLCGRTITDLSRASGIDVSPEDEYYADMKPVCPRHAEGSDE